jgi:hypothetical protein
MDVTRQEFDELKRQMTDINKRIAHLEHDMNDLNTNMNKQFSAAILHLNTTSEPGSEPKSR